MSYVGDICTTIAGRRAPYGARGLKLLIGGAIGIFGRVAPRMGRVD